MCALFPAPVLECLQALAVPFLATSSGDCLAVGPVAEEMQTFTIAFDCGTSRMFEELEDPTEETLWELFAKQCPADLEIQKLDGHAIKNLRYPNLPMVADLQNATKSLEENTLIAALAGDKNSKDALREDISDTRQDAPNFIPPQTRVPDTRC